ncbi:MAG: DUF3791 domain-containing protein [Barnesiella sp.]|nr:DUF3791 domain-containing protein [Barnesiella sp.]
MIERSHEDDVAYFIAFCIELYKNGHSKNGAETSALFEKYGIMKFLQDNFEVLHTQSPEWILDEINDLIEEEQK